MDAAELTRRHALLHLRRQGIHLHEAEPVSERKPADCWALTDLALDVIVAEHSRSSIRIARAKAERRFDTHRKAEHARRGRRS